MPWVLLALLGVTGVAYYESQKARPGYQRWQLTFPASLEGDALRTAVLALADSLGGQVVKIKSPGVYLVDMPKSVEPTMFGTPLAVPGAVKVGGSSLGGEAQDLYPELDSYLQDDDRLPSIDVAGMRWDGARLTTR